MRLRSQNRRFSCLKIQKLYEIWFCSTQASRSKRVVQAGETTGGPDNAVTSYYIMYINIYNIV